MTDLAGGPDMPARGVLATNGRLHEPVLARLAAGARAAAGGLSRSLCYAPGR